MITDAELLKLRGTSGLYHPGHLAAMFGIILKRPVTVEEMHDAVRRLNARYGDSPEDGLQANEP